MRQNKLFRTDSSTIFLFLYGLIVQVVSFAVIYIYGKLFPDMESLTEKLILIWYFIPVIAVFSVAVAGIQIKDRKQNQERYKTPLIGLILNILWILGYLLVLYIALSF